MGVRLIVVVWGFNVPFLGFSGSESGFILATSSVAVDRTARETMRRLRGCCFQAICVDRRRCQTLQSLCHPCSQL